MKFKKSLFLAILALLFWYPRHADAIPAFPGAEGFGAETRGGRGGKIIKVNNLNDSGPGSFREAVLSSGPRIIVFEVSGIINLASRVRIENPYLTIAGQTSPGGILITGHMVLIDTYEVIVQHMRFRVGSHRIASGADPETLDSLTIWGSYWGHVDDAYNIIIDHCSMGWGVDETMSVTGGVRNATIQWSIISESLSHAGHPKGEHSKGLLVDGKYQVPQSVSLHHNYFAHNNSRSPQVSTPAGVDQIVDAVNNVSYNWYGGNSPKSSGSGMAKVNWVYNYSKKGPDSNSYSFDVMHNPSSSPAKQIYVFGNIGSKRMSQSDPNQWYVGYSWQNRLLSEEWRTTTRWDAPPVNSNEMTYEYALEMLKDVGATKPIRDSVDARVVGDFEAGTGRIIDNVSYPADFPKFSTPQPPLDSDNDGMADSWERANGFNISINDSASDNDKDGYTNIEEYLHDLSGTTAVVDLISPSAPTSLMKISN
jgi:pectate lyase